MRRQMSKITPDSIEKVTSSGPFIPDQTSDTPLQCGIHHHESGNLPLAVHYFEQAAHAGQPLGYYFLGMSLRHGWGCQTDTIGAVVAFRKSIEIILQSLPNLTRRFKQPGHSILSEADPMVVVDLSPQDLEEIRKSTSPTASAEEASPMTSKSTKGSDHANKRLSYAVLKGPPTEIGHLEQDLDFVKELLPIPLYELATCYRYGWGIKKNLSLASSLYTIGARLGDLDSQLTLTHLYLHEGSKLSKSKKQAAYWLRQAESNGWSSFNQKWIWKSKYDPAPNEPVERLVCGPLESDIETVIEMVNQYHDFMDHTLQAAHRSWFKRCFPA